MRYFTKFGLVLLLAVFSVVAILVITFSGIAFGAGKNMTVKPDSNSVANLVPITSQANNDLDVSKPVSNKIVANTPSPTSTLAPSPTPTSTPVPSYPKPSQEIPLVGQPTPVTFTGKGQLSDRTFFSTLLNKNMSYRIYLPPGYDSSQQRYPVLYMLHGYSGKDEEWTWYNLPTTVDSMITSGKAKPFIVVMPTGEQEYWMDHPNDGPKWAEYVAKEVVDYIDGNYRTIPLKESRAIGGLSMGGNGALQISMNYPGIFGVVGAHSPTMRTYAQKLPWWGDESWFAQNDPIQLAKTSDYIGQVKLWIDIGLNDQTWRPRALELKQVLEDRHISFTWTDYPGDHVPQYWTDHVGDYLTWYAANLDFKTP
ncbi:MAG TPA: alpha/beta hydrolase-fold protein [Chloroflexia bacterium]|nr:alpha/beta hydrolase-fold protein [Chloroflexia bacterium]